MTLPRATDEIKIADSSDWKIFDQIEKDFAEVFKTKSLAVCDGLDEAYYDHDIEGTVVTIHLQHYLGVRIFLRYPNDATEKDLVILGKIRDHYQNAEPSTPADDPEPRRSH